MDVNLNKPFGEQIAERTGDFKENASASVSAATDAVSNSLGNIANSVKDLRGTIQNSVSEFSPKEAGNEFLQSNSIVAKFVFLLLVLIVFMFLMNTGIKLISYFLRPTRNPYIINGMRNGNQRKVVSQDPSKSGSITIYRSNNEETGMEFTWNTWLRVDDITTDDSKFGHIFSKGGNGRPDGSNQMTMNAPGLYLKPKGNTLVLKMDGQQSTTEEIEIPNIPMRRWFNLSIRLQNKILDVYVNGTVAKRVVFETVPKQNYDDIYVCYNGGFPGSLSNLRYFDSALNVFQINNIVMAGPNLKADANDSQSGSFDYLSGLWYSGA